MVTESNNNSERKIGPHSKINLLDFISETLRKHPVAGAIMRVATKAFNVPNTDFTIPKGMLVFIPILGIHHDEHFYPNPEEFIPERFPDNVRLRKFLPFGEGIFLHPFFEIIFCTFFVALYDELIHFDCLVSFQDKDNVSALISQKHSSNVAWYRFCNILNFQHAKELKYRSCTPVPKTHSYQVTGFG